MKTSAALGRFAIVLALLAFALITPAAGLAAAPATTSWNVATDWVLGSNPTGPWSYGWSATRGGLFHQMTAHNPDSHIGVEDWAGPFPGAGGFFPHIGHNSTAVTLNYPCCISAAGGVYFHPGPQGQNAVIRWTAPAGGDYAIAASWAGVDRSGITHTSPAVLHNGQVLFFTVLRGQARQSWNGSATLAAGDTLDFALDPHGDYSFGTTSARIQINLTTPLDSAAPVTTASLNPSPNAGGWNNADVTVSLSSSDGDGGSGVKQIAYSASGAQPIAATTASGGSASVSITTEGATVLTYAATDNAGNAETPKTVTVQLDKTAPTIAGSASPAPNANGWNNSAVTVSFSCADALSGIASCSSPTTVSAEGAGQQVNGTASDKAGNNAGASVSVSIDETTPKVTYSGNAGSYEVDQTVNISCTATDPANGNGTAGSGIASSTCRTTSGAAYTFTIGANPLSSTATDKADNSGGGSTTFNVVVDVAGLSRLIGQFVSNPGVASSMQSEVASIGSAPNSHAKAGKLGAFTNHLNAQTGKTITADHAAILVRLAGYL